MRCTILDVIRHTGRDLRLPVSLPRPGAQRIAVITEKIAGMNHSGHMIRKIGHRNGRATMKSRKRMDSNNGISSRNIGEVSRGW